MKNLRLAAVRRGSCWLDYAFNTLNGWVTGDAHFKQVSASLYIKMNFGASQAQMQHYCKLTITHHLPSKINSEEVNSIMTIEWFP